MITGAADEVRRSPQWCRSDDRRTSARAEILSSMIQGNADPSLARPLRSGQAYHDSRQT
jgi:hypothetical protein